MRVDVHCHLYQANCLDEINRKLDKILQNQEELKSSEEMIRRLTTGLDTDTQKLIESEKKNASTSSS